MFNKKLKGELESQGYSNSLMSSLKAFLVAQGYSKALPEALNLWLGDRGYSGNTLSERLSQWEEAEYVMSTFTVTMTGLTSGEAIIGTHASVGYTINPDNGTETVKWSNSATASDPATYGTGASPTDFTAGDTGSLYCHVSDGSETVTKSALIRYAAGTAPAIADGQSWTVDDTAISIDASASGANLTWTYSLSNEPAGVSINASSGLITGTVTSASSGTITVTATDQYGRTVQDTFTWASTLRTQATGGVDLDLAFPEDSAITSTDLLQNWTTNSNTLTLVSVSPTLPTGLSVSSAGAMTGTPTTITADATYTITMQDEYGRQTSDTFTLEITAAATAPVISSTLFTDSSDTWDLVTDQPSNGNWHWARYANGTTGITADGAGGWSSTPQESGTLAVGAASSSIQIPETGTTGTVYEMFLYQRNTSSADSNVLTVSYTADNTNPSVSSAATDTGGSVITLTASETVTGSPATGDFTFAGISAGTPTIDSVVVSGTSITITISGNLVANGDTVTASYTKGANTITDAHGNEMATFASQSVTNNVPSASSTTYQGYSSGESAFSSTHTYNSTNTPGLDATLSGRYVVAIYDRANKGVSSISIGGATATLRQTANEGSNTMLLYDGVAGGSNNNIVANMSASGNAQIFVWKSTGTYQAGNAVIDTTNPKSISLDTNTTAGQAAVAAWGQATGTAPTITYTGLTAQTASHAFKTRSLGSGDTLGGVAGGTPETFTIASDGTGGGLCGILGIYS